MCYIIQVSLISKKEMWAKGLNILFQRLEDQENENEDSY